jgi:hypothetical protein
LFKINEICSIVKDHPDNIVSAMAQCILAEMNSLDIDIINRMFVDMLCQLAKTHDECTCTDESEICLQRSGDSKSESDESVDPE